MKANYFLNNRESATIVHLRNRERLSMNHIAEIMERSTRTVHRKLTSISNLLLNGKRDNRRLPHNVRVKQASKVRKRLAELKVRTLLFLRGDLQSLTDAFQIQSLPINLMRQYALLVSEGKNWSEEPP